MTELLGSPLFSVSVDGNGADLLSAMGRDLLRRRILIGRVSIPRRLVSVEFSLESGRLSLSSTTFDSIANDVETRNLPVKYIHKTGVVISQVAMKVKHIQIEWSAEILVQSIRRGYKSHNILPTELITQSYPHKIRYNLDDFQSSLDNKRDFAVVDACVQHKHQWLKIGPELKKKKRNPMKFVRLFTNTIKLCNVYSPYLNFDVVVVVVKTTNGMPSIQFPLNIH